MSEMPNPISSGLVFIDYFKNQEPRYGKTFSQALVSFFKTKDVPKIINYGVQWAGRVTTVSSNVNHLGAFSGDVKNFMSAAEVYSKLREIVKAVKVFFGLAGAEQKKLQYSASAGRMVVKKATDGINAVCDTTKLASRFFSMPKVFDGIGSGATLVGSATSLIDDSIKLHNDIQGVLKITKDLEGSYSKDLRNPLERRKIIKTQLGFLHSLGIVTDLSYLSVGVSGLYTFITGVIVPQTLIPLTVALVCSIFMHFTNELANPEGRNDDPEKLKHEVRLPKSLSYTV